MDRTVTVSAAPIRIAFCITELDSGGAEHALVELVTRLDRKEWAPAVFCLDKPGVLVNPLEQAGVPVTCLYSRRSLRVVERLARELRQWKPRLLQTYLSHANIAGRLAARRAGVERVVSGIRVAERGRRWPLWIDRWTERYVDRHVAVGQAVADFSIATGGLSREKMYVIPNGVDVARFRDAPGVDLTTLGIPTNARTILFVGRLTEQKNPLLIARVFGTLAERHSDLHLLMVGEGPLNDQVRAIGFADRIHLLGRRDDIPGLMQASDCLVLPSRWEGMPNVILEAMAAGLPVLASSIDGVCDLVQDRVNGRLFVPNSDASLRDAIEASLADWSMTEKMAITAHHIVAKSFTWNSTTCSYVNLYRELLDRTPSRSSKR